MPLYFSEREIVLPGQLLSDDSKRSGEGTYVLGNKVYASTVGFATIKNDKVCVIPFKGAYTPQPGDRVIGIVIDVKPNGFEVSLGRHLIATIRMPDKKEVQALNLKVGEVVYAYVKESGLRGVFLEAGEKIKKDEYLGFLNKELVAHHKNLVNVLDKIYQKCKLEEHEILTVFVGSSATPIEQSIVEKYTKKKYPNVQIEFIEGGQPHYPFLMMVE